MMIWIKNKRKDGKYTVTYGFDSGKRIHKIVTSETLKKDMDRIEPHNITISNIAMQFWPIR